MAQINITLSQEEVLQVLTGNRDDAFKFLMERILNEIMKAESAEQLGAERHERSEDRKDYRNGTRERNLVTRIGSLKLQVPRHRNEPFHTMVFENYKRSEAALIATMVQMVVSGVSTRKVAKVVEELCGESFSKSTVSELCKSLDEVIKEFKNRPIENAPFVMVDATYFKVRENHRTITKAFHTALVFSEEGRREIVDFEVFDAEDNYSWISFLQRLKERGLTSPLLVISDAHKSIINAVGKVYPGTAWQRCQVHLTRNILDSTPAKYKDGLKRELREMFNASTIEESRKIRNQIVDDYYDIAPNAMKSLEDGFEDCMTIMDLPEYMRVHVRNTNKLERINREFKRRSNALQVFPNKESILRLMGAVAMEYNDALVMQQKLFTQKRLRRMYEDGIAIKFAKIAKEQQFAHAA